MCEEGRRGDGFLREGERGHVLGGEDTWRVGGLHGVQMLGLEFGVVLWVAN